MCACVCVSIDNRWNIIEFLHSAPGVVCACAYSCSPIIETGNCGLSKPCVFRFLFLPSSLHLSPGRRTRSYFPSLSILHSAKIHSVALCRALSLCNQRHAGKHRQQQKQQQQMAGKGWIYADLIVFSLLKGCILSSGGGLVEVFRVYFCTQRQTNANDANGL